ncbi:MAG: hypothetical protein WCK16_00280 [Candidatus Moraniibacteriota bacterium]
MHKIKSKKYFVNKKKFAGIFIFSCFVLASQSAVAISFENISCWDGVKYVAGNKNEDCASIEIKNSEDVVAPTCSVSFSLNKIIVPGISSLSWSSFGADKMIGSCTGPVPLIKADYGLNYSGYPFSFSIDQIGTQTCTFIPFSGSVAGGACFASVIIEDADNTETTVPIKPICRPDNPDCAKSTCKDVYCSDGCVRQRGTRECTGRE